MKTISKSCIALVALLFSLTLTNAQTTLFFENFGKPSATTFITAYTGWQNASPITFEGTADVRTTSASTYTNASASGNVFITYSGTKDFIVSGINTSGYTDIAISLGFLTSSTKATADSVSFQVSSNGTNWTDLVLPSMPADTKWAYYTLNGNVPATSTLYFKVLNKSIKACQYRIDDIKITGVGAAIPTISTSASAFSYTSIQNLEKSDSLSISGSDLSENINIALSGADASMFTVSTTTVPSAGTTKIGVNYNPTAVGDHTATLTITSSGKTKTVHLTGKAYAAQASAWVEDFEAGLKTSYGADTITCTQGDWDLTEALLGTSTSDKTFGKQSVRIKNKDGYAAMNFDKTNGAGIVTAYISLYASHATASKWVLCMSTNAGSTWTQVGDTVTTTNGSLAPVQFTVNQTGNVRFKIIKTLADSNNSLNIDNISITDYTGTLNLAEGKEKITIYSVSNALIINLEEAANIEIFNLQGHKLQIISASEGQNIINLKSGIYLVKVGTQVQKIIVR